MLRLSVASLTNNKNVAMCQKFKAESTKKTRIHTLAAEHMNKSNNRTKHSIYIYLYGIPYQIAHWNPPAQ